MFSFNSLKNNFFDITYFKQIQQFLAHDALHASAACAMATLSVRRSVTLVDCVKMAEQNLIIVKRFSHSSFLLQNILAKLQRCTKCDAPPYEAHCRKRF